MQSPDFKVRLADEGAEPESGSPEQFRALIGRDIDKFRRIVTQAKVSVQ